MSDSFEVTHLDALERHEDSFVTLPVRTRFGIESFGINAYAAREAGGEVIEEHDELGAGAGRHEELYVVLSGRARFSVDGEELDAPAGTLVFVRDSAARRHAVAETADTIVLVVGGTPGRAFAPSPWEAWLEALPSYERQEYGRAVEVMREALARHPDNSNVLYNLACVESLAGETESALAHLTRAVELEPRAREWAQSDPDLDALRDDSRFPG